MIEQEIITLGAVGAMLVELRWSVSRIHQRLERMEDGHSVLKARVRKITASALYLIACGAILFALSGCSFDGREAVKGATAGATTGFQLGGPVGATIGGIAFALVSGFAAKRHRQCKRRENIIRHYRVAHGDISSDALEKIKKGVSTQ